MLERSPLDLTLVGVWIATALSSRGILAWRASRLARRALAEGTPGHAIYGLARSFGWVMGLSIPVSAFVSYRVAGPAVSTSGTAGFLCVLLTVWWIYRGYATQARRVLGTVRGAEWDNPLHTDLAALVLGPLLAVPIAASALALLLHAMGDAADLSIPPLASALCVYPGIPAAGTFLRSVARRMFKDGEALPAAVASHVDAALGPRAAEGMAVLPTHGAAFYNAVAVFGIPSASIWMSEPLVRLLSPQEAAAVLVHETSHRDRRDDLRRMTVAIGMHAALLAAAALGWRVGLEISCFLFLWAFLIASTILGQPQELVADARARELGLGEALGKALVALHRINHVPRGADSESFETHPPLEKRLRALGVEIPEATVEEAPLPSGQPSRTVWVGITLVLMVMFVAALALTPRISQLTGAP